MFLFFGLLAESYYDHDSDGVLKESCWLDFVDASGT